MQSFDAIKGTGWITQDDGGPDVSVRFSDVQPPGPLEEGQAVSFDVTQGPNGTLAENVVSL